MNQRMLGVQKLISDARGRLARTAEQVAEPEKSELMEISASLGELAQRTREVHRRLLTQQEKAQDQLAVRSEEILRGMESTESN